MECAAWTRARAVSRRVACHPARASCNRTKSHREARPLLSGARRHRPWRFPPRRTAQAPSRSNRAPVDYPPPAAILFFCALPCLSRASWRSLSPVEVSALPAGLFHENDVRDFHTFVEGFAHIVDREGRGGYGDQCFHFHACLGSRGHRGLHFYAILA